MGGLFIDHCSLTGKVDHHTRWRYNNGRTSQPPHTVTLQQWPDQSTTTHGDATAMAGPVKHHTPWRYSNGWTSRPPHIVTLQQWLDQSPTTHRDATAMTGPVDHRAPWRYHSTLVVYTTAQLQLPSPSSKSYFFNQKPSIGGQLKRHDNALTHLLSERVGRPLIYLQYLLYLYFGPKSTDDIGQIHESGPWHLYFWIQITRFRLLRFR